MAKIFLVSILNLTPDSFSDGGRQPTSLSDQIDWAHRELEAGASIIDVGGDSTRPGSVCVPHDEEWRRIGPFVKALAGKVPLSVDTHHLETAKRCLDLGVEYINDVSGGSAELFQLIARYDCSIVIMYSSFKSPHVFDEEKQSPSIEGIKEFFNSKRTQALDAGMKDGRIIFDPGMGAFLSKDPADSFAILKNLNKFSDFFPLYLGISRKGFLGALIQESAKERDLLSAIVSDWALNVLSSETKIFLRVHHIPIHQTVLSLHHKIAVKEEARGGC